VFQESTFDLDQDELVSGFSGVSDEFSLFHFEKNN